jgi:hypothetical protein
MTIPYPEPTDPTQSLAHPVVYEHMASVDHSFGDPSAGSDAELRAQQQEDIELPPLMGPDSALEGTLIDRIRARREGSR